jgi:hypothetical protein
MKSFVLLAVTIIALFLWSCKKERFISTRDARINLSEDTLRYDTVFTSAGSITQFVKIKNENNQKLLLSDITLKGGASSFFKLNADGNIGPDVKNLEIDAKDSTYIFVSVRIDPTSANLPFLIRDSIEIKFNGNTQWIQLEAWGQNANFLRSRRITGDITWTNNLPYVILGGVQVDTTATLTIEKGCRIYLHADAPFLIDGTLKVNGEKFDSTRVYFLSDRLDKPYRDFPGSWPGIYFRGKSKDNVLQYAVIRNAFQGVISEQVSVNSNPKLTLNECIIDNIFDAGILAVQSSITARNCLISNCGKNILLAYGGNYEFEHCTAASISNAFITHKEPVLFVSNNIKDRNNNILTSSLSASFKNCIFWGENGTVENEAFVSKQGTTPFSVQFSHCLWKVKTTPANSSADNILSNQSPVFDSINVEKRFFDFRLKKDKSPAINKGMVGTIMQDLDGKSRPVGLPDLGCYERH